MKFILAEKKGMTQKYAEDGTVIPVTKVVAGPCVVTQIKTEKNDGYTAIQLGFGAKKNISKPVKGHLKSLGNFKYLKEFRISSEEAKTLAVGNKITAKIFTSGDTVAVSGVSKGKGFQGVIKRHGFHGSPATHGHKDQLRHSGSVGAGGPQHVFKGTKMAGRMGQDQVTVKNLKIIEVSPESNEVYIKGAIPGANNNLVLIAGNGQMVVETEAKPVAATADVAVEKPAEVPAEPVVEETKPAENQTENNPNT